MKNVATIFILCCLAGSFAGGCGLNDTPAIKAACSINGYGVGTCNFTNMGKQPGTACVKVKVVRLDKTAPPLVSSTVCSGTVGVRETVTKPVTVLNTSRLCRTARPARDPWTSVCDVIIIRE